MRTDNSPIADLTRVLDYPREVLYHPQMTCGDNDPATVPFPQFALFPPEIRIKIWQHYVAEYEDNLPVAWRIMWGIDEIRDTGKARQQGWEKHIRIRPFIYFDSQKAQKDLVEFNCCPLLKVNHEAREQALQSCRYASVPVMGQDIHVIVKAIDIFFPDDMSLSRLVRNWEQRHGPLVSITLSDDMSFARRILVAEDDLAVKLRSHQNWTLSATPPNFFSEDRWALSLITIAQTYLRNAKVVYFERRGIVGARTGVSGSQFIPFACDQGHYNSTPKGTITLCHKLIADPSYRTNPAAWNLVSRLHQYIKNGNLCDRIFDLGEIGPTDGAFLPDGGPRIGAVSCFPGQLSQQVSIYEYCLDRFQAMMSSRVAQPFRRSQAIPPRTTTSNNVPSTLPLRERPQGRLLKVVGTGDGNFFRERHCYSPIFPVSPFPVDHPLHDLTSLRAVLPNSSGARGCPRCHKKQWLITGSKPRLTTVCQQSTYWASHYTYTGADWDFSGKDNLSLPNNWDKAAGGPRVRINERRYDLGDYNSDDEAEVVEHGRKEALRAWEKSLDAYMDDEKLIDTIAKNQVVAKQCGLREAMKPGWKNRPRPHVEEGDGGEERLLFWDDMAVKSPEMGGEEIKEMEGYIRGLNEWSDMVA
ncbi:hypothetical protein QBC40DRAFT_292700 [Triangularia verruculosa]|uniref:2EXR domain-containing protein n=1 Tax=Triangularia verruculosa TaxID=2587418 RepID=A0AAN6XPL7_9PEZI|nr:hypothetical protein QBC40DRAFT_292700 [Triangularia verruculosa]